MLLDIEKLIHFNDSAVVLDAIRGRVFPLLILISMERSAVG
jgi:hypothetical protein